MSRYQVRPLESSDFQVLMDLEEQLFGDSSEGTLGAYDVRLCCDFFAESCFLLEVEGRPVGYLLSFLKGREVYCTTLGLLPQMRGTRGLVALLRAFVLKVADQVDCCWFTVEEDNQAARALHEMLGAREVESRPDFYGPGRARLISRIEREDVERLQARFLRLGLVERSTQPKLVA